MPEIFNYDFMIRALLAGILIAGTMPLLGNFLVARKYSLIADSLAHVSLAGVGLGLLAGAAPISYAIPVALLGALLLEWLRQKKRLSGEIGLALLMSGGLALAVVFANLAKGSNVDFTSFLFGSITTTTNADLITLCVAVVVVIGCIGANYRAFLHIAFDEDSARLHGYRVSVLNYLLVALTAIMVVLSLRIIGGLLASALLVIPVVAASNIARSFGATIIYSVIIALIAVLGGLVLAFYAGIAAGSAIVLCALVLLIASMILKR